MMPAAPPSDSAPVAPPTESLGRERFIRLRRPQRIWAVAAIHGEADRVSALHDRIERAWRPGDRIVYLGNYLGRGAAVRATIDEILGFRRAVMAQPGGFACDVAFLRGSQEEMWQKLLQLQFAVSPSGARGASIPTRRARRPSSSTSVSPSVTAATRLLSSASALWPTAN